MNKLLLLVGLALVVVLSGAPIALADDTICPPDIVGGTHDNVIVPPGQVCRMSGATVKGNVKVFGALDTGGPRNFIGGNVDGEPGHDFLELFSDTIRGNVQVKKQSSQPSASNEFLTGSTVGGNVQYEENTRRIIVLDSSIGVSSGGDLKIEKNTGGGNITRNTIAGNLMCKENAPPPTGAGNTVGGNKEEQCAGF